MKKNIVVKELKISDEAAESYLQVWAQKAI